jgi:hypothetical protein
MVHGATGRLAQSRVHPLAPAAVALAGILWLATGHTAVGAGIAVGAVLAYVNAILLSRRVDLAAMTGNVGGAMMVMQVGLLVTLTIVGVATVVLVRLSLSMAVAAAAGFAATQMAILLLFYVLRARNQSVSTETQIT